MYITAEICVIPLNGKISLREEVALAHSILRKTGLHVDLHSYGTNIEGDYELIMNAIKEIHETLHNNGTPRVHTSIKIGSRKDKTQSLQDKVNAVDSLLSKQFNL